MQVITTVPYAPRHGAVPGYFLGPLTAHLFGAALNIESFIALNTIGTKGYTLADVGRFVNITSVLCGRRPLIWHDEKQNWSVTLSEWAERGLEDGWLTHEIRDVYRCTCGFVEFLLEPLNLVASNFKRKVYNVVHNKIW